MKKIIYLLFLLPFIGKAQVYQNMTQYGYNSMRFGVDSALTIPKGLVSVRTNNARFDTAQIRYNKSDSSVYVYTGNQWIKAIRASGGSSDSSTFFTVYRGDTMRFNLWRTSDTMRRNIYGTFDTLRRNVWGTFDTARKNLYPLIETKWSTTGNAGLNSSTNFLGTTDDVDVVFRRQNLPAGRLGSNYTFFGNSSGDSNTGTLVTGIGQGAASGNTGNDVVAIGESAASGNTGNDVVAIGKHAGDGNTGGPIVAIGQDALNANIGGDVIAIGKSSLNGNTGNNNVALGQSALESNTGNNNVALGSSGNSNTGDNNTFLGHGAGNNNTSSNSTFLGYNATATGTLTNATAIGYNATVTQSNSLVLGSGANVGIGTTAPDSTLHVVGGLKFPSLYRSNNASDSMLVIKSDGGIGYRTIPTGNPGTVTSVATGYGLSGGTITSSGTLLIDSSTLSNKYIRIGDTANYFAPYRTKIQLNTDSISAHNTRIGKNNDSLISHNTRIGAVTTSVGAKQDTASAWQTSGNYNSGLRYLGSRTRQGVGLITSDSVRVYLDSLGRVGIGNTPQTTSQRLYVEGTPTTYLQGVAKFRSNFSASSTNPAYSVLIGGQNTANNTLLLGVDGFGNALIAGNNTSFFRLGRDNGSGTFTPIIDIQSGGAIINNSAGNNITSSAVFEVVSTTKGFLPPKMTTTQRDAISSPAAGLIIYNTTTNAINVYNGTAWKEISVL